MFIAKDNLNKDISGIRIGRLTVIELDHKEGWSNYWRCICNCGNTVVVKRSSLTRIKRPTQSCGCLREDNHKIAMTGKASKARLEYGEASFNSLFRNYQYNAKIRGIVFEISKEDFKKMVKLNCFYCGREPSSIRAHGCGTYGSFIYNGLDRLNSDDGYTVNNSVTCCQQCNRMKGRMKYGDFIDLVKEICSRH